MHHGRQRPWPRRFKTRAADGLRTDCKAGPHDPAHVAIPSSSSTCLIDLLWASGPGARKQGCIRAGVHSLALAAFHAHPLPALRAPNVRSGSRALCRAPQRRQSNSAASLQWNALWTTCPLPNAKARKPIRTQAMDAQIVAFTCALGSEAQHRCQLNQAESMKPWRRR